MLQVDKTSSAKPSCRIRQPASRILVVDDNEANRDLLSRRLVREGYHVIGAENGAAALALTAAEGFDLVLLDLMMPGMSGFEVLCRLKADARTRHIPVIMISALDELDSTVRCIEAGAEDYLPKPFNPVLLRARISASLEKKRLLDELRAEKERSEALLLNILPRTIVERMRRGETVIADRIAEATILFADLVGFTALAARLLSRGDRGAAGRDLLSVRRAGRPATGSKRSRPPATATWWRAGFRSREPITPRRLRRWRSRCSMPSRPPADAVGEQLQLRIGLNTGALIAGVLGTQKFVYDVWGDTVNTAKRMESYGLPGRVHVSAATRLALGDAFRFEPRGALEVKGKGSMETYFLYRH